MGIGPRIARVHVGAGRTGFSSGAGPFSYYTSAGSRRRSASGGRSHGGAGAAAARQLLAAQQAVRQQAAEQAHAQLVAAERRLVTLHLEEFPHTVPPPNDGPPPVNQAEVLAALERQELATARRFDRVAKYDARQRAAAALPAAVAWEEQRRWAEHRAHRQADWAAYQRLAANDPSAVLGALEAAFADNESPAVPTDCDGARASIVVVIGGIDDVPDRRPERTPTGQPRMTKRSKGERNDLYVRRLASTVLATVKEAFAVAPGLSEAAVLVVRRDPAALDPASAVAAVYAGSFTRATLGAWNWPSVDPLEQVLLAPGAMLNRRGQARDVAPLDLRHEPELRVVVDVVRSALHTGQRVDGDRVRSAVATPIREAPSPPTPPAPAPTAPAPSTPAPLPPDAVRPPAPTRSPNRPPSVILTKGGNAPVPTARLTVTTITAGRADLSAVLLDEHHRAINDEAIAFYNQPELLGGAVRYSADDGAGQQQLDVDLSALPSTLQRAALAVSVDETSGVRLGDLPPIESVVHGNGEALLQYTVDGLTTERAAVLLELYRHRGGWKVRAVGQGYDDGLAGLARDFGISVED